MLTHSTKKQIPRRGSGWPIIMVNLKWVLSMAFSAEGRITGGRCLIEHPKSAFVDSVLGDFKNSTLLTIESMQIPKNGITMWTVWTCSK
jgi:hypothetical protein